jgi:hypothetical protein
MTKKAKNPKSSPAKIPVREPANKAMLRVHQWVILFKIKKPITPIKRPPIDDVETKNVLNPFVNDF